MKKPPVEIPEGNNFFSVFNDVFFQAVQFPQNLNRYLIKRYLLPSVL